MTGKEKIEAALSAEGTSEFAAVLPYDELYLRDRWDELTARPWWEQFDPDLDVHVKWRNEVIERLGQDWFQVPFSYSDSERENLALEIGDDTAYLCDRASGTRHPLQRPQVSGWNPQGKLESVQVNRWPDTEDEIDRIIPEPADEDPADLQGRDSLARRMLSDSAADLYPITRTSSPLWSCYDLWGFEGLMVMIAERPELVRYACERILNLRRRDVLGAASLGAEAIWIEECVTDQITPDSFQALNVPFMRGLTEAIREAGLRSIYYFCGDPKGKWDEILSIGADALALEEGKKGFEIDIEDVVDIVEGRCALLGNLDAVGVLEQSDDEMLQSEVSRQIEAGRRNKERFIMSLGSPATPDTPLSRVRRFCDLVHGT